MNLLTLTRDESTQEVTSAYFTLLCWPPTYTRFFQFIGEPLVAFAY